MRINTPQSQCPIRFDVFGQSLDFIQRRKCLSVALVTGLGYKFHLFTKPSFTLKSIGYAGANERNFGYLAKEREAKEVQTLDTGINNKFVDTGANL
ncbi:hypothetical protein [Orrella sp. 11846]|uniref:hypothetical protein n=1 Tax=Orrella sp. 11846 TaxID=3409913 RepID=UPI003B5A1E3B